MQLKTLDREELAYLAATHVLHRGFAQQKVDKVAGLEVAHELCSVQPVVVVLLGAQKPLAIHLKYREKQHEWMPDRDEEM